MTNEKKVYKIQVTPESHKTIKRIAIDLDMKLNQIGDFILDHYLKTKSENK
jgi:cell division protein ZapA (FtsZ GTPase activity inhibitor)